MKLLSFVSSLSLLGLSSCQLSSEKAKEEAAESSGSIPPPKNLLVADSSSSQQEELPDLSAAPEPDEEPKKEVNVIEAGDFIFRDPLKDLPTQRDLASPPAPLIPAPEEDIESKATSESGPPLVTNP